jgi:hypothetical protein
MLKTGLIIQEKIDHAFSNCILKTMTKVVVTGCMVLMVGLAGVLYTVHGVSRGPDQASISELKSQLRACGDSIDVLDFAIIEGLRNHSKAAGSSRKLDSLKARQEALQHRYAHIRKTMVLAFEGSLFLRISNFILKAIGKIGWIFLFLGLFFVLILSIRLVLPKPEAARISIKKEESLPSIPIREETFPDKTEETAKEAADHPVVESEKTETESGPEFLTEVQPADNNREPYYSLPATSEPVAEEGHEESSVPVDHLSNQVHMDLPPKPPIQEEPPAELPEKIVELKNFFPENKSDASEDEIEETGIQVPSNWDKYEQDQQQKAAVVRLARRGSTVSEISKRLNISQDEVELLIKAGRDY